MLHFTEYHTRLAGYAAIVDEHDRILLTYWNGEGRHAPEWTMPGGGVEFEEDVPAAILREVYEETGYGIDLGQLLVVDTWFRGPDERDGPAAKPFKAVRVVHRARIVGGTLGTTEQGGSTDEARWFPIAEVAGLARTELVDVVIAALRDTPRFP